MGLMRYLGRLPRVDPPDVNEVYHTRFINAIQLVYFLCILYALVTYIFEICRKTTPAHAEDAEVELFDKKKGSPTGTNGPCRHPD
jgi:cbb3-type cytochrome oxidase subunit 3